jgi:hypothetical protein
MVAVYEGNFGYYDLEADPDEPAFLAFVKSQSKLRKSCAAASRSNCSRGARLARDAATRWNTALPPSETETRLAPVGGLRPLTEKGGPPVRP